MNLIGQFVESQSLGFGKVVGSQGSKYQVEFFISPWKRTVSTHALKFSMIKTLHRQSRVFTEDSGKWRMGRIEMEYLRDGGGFDYDVRFPNSVMERLSGERLFTRCLLPFDDPTSMLANGAMETQFWHDRRADFASQLFSQRAATRGLYSLLSSSIEFVPHQIEVARRVLEDPLQRYVLADEVGMGKTIEAGLILRQFLLTNEIGAVWVIVPSPLVRQWKRELEQKFFVGNFPGRVFIYSFDEIRLIAIDAPEFVIVDEAHHVVSGDLPQWLHEIGSRARHLLLLTATPSLANSKVFLRLLQLIDPGAYLNVSQVDFENRLEQREQLGIFMRGLRVNTSPILLRQRLQHLKKHFPNDSEAHSWGTAISQAVKTNDASELTRKISGLRAHIADVYRIHQRLIRTRRSDAASWVFRPRGPSINPLENSELSHVLLTWSTDEVVPDFAEMLEQWRLEFLTKYPSDSSRRTEVRKLFISLFEALSRGSCAFVRAWKAIPDDLQSSGVHRSFEGEFPQLELSETNGRSCEIARAIGLSMRQFKSAHGRAPRVVVFGSDDEDLGRCAEAIGKEIGRTKVLVAGAINSIEEDIAAKFESDPVARVLICGRRNEEGLNLHYADLLIHLDLPFSPERIEQRIGRLDRFGRKTDFIKQRILLPGPIDEDFSYWDAWFDLLADGFHIFNSPLTDMQFLLSELTDQLAETVFEEGAIGLRNAIPIVRERLQAEREKLDNQYTLDRVLQDEEGAAYFCQQLEDAETDENQLSFVAKRWFGDCLKFQMRGDIQNIFKVVWDDGYTLLPILPWANVFARGLKGSNTFSRKIANFNRNQIQLQRVGSTLYVAAERHLQWEDRGTAFATWRHEPSVGDTTWIAFKLCYQIEGELPQDIPIRERLALRARIDGYLPPWVETLYVGSDLNQIVDPTMLEILRRPYQPGNMTSGDLNLGSRPELLQQVIDADLFDRLCRVVRKESENWLRSQTKFCETINTALTRGTVDLEHRSRRLKMRQTILKNEDVDEMGLLREIEFNNLLINSLGMPKIRLDSIGMIVVSGEAANVEISR